MLGGPSSKRAADGAPARQQQPVGAQRVAIGVRQHSVSATEQQGGNVLGSQQQAAAARVPVAATAASVETAAAAAELPGSSKAGASAQRLTRSRSWQQLASSVSAAPCTTDVTESTLGDGSMAEQRVAQPARAVKTRKLAPSAVLPTSVSVACDAAGAVPMSPTGLLSVPTPPLRQGQQVLASACSGSEDDSKGTPRSERRVRFAPGPLEATPDGHPATEGCIARPVRQNPCLGWGQDLTRGNVLLLESLLGAECQESVLRLKRRVGLLPLIRPPRPHATSKAPSPTRAATVKTVKAALRAAKAAKGGGGAGASKDVNYAADDVIAADQGLWVSNGIAT